MNGMLALGVALIALGLTLAACALLLSNRDARRRN